MNKLILSLMSLLVLQNCNTFADGQDYKQSATTFVKKYGPGALKIAAGFIWLKEIGTQTYTFFIPNAQRGYGAKYCAVLEIENRQEGTFRISPSDETKMYPWPSSSFTLKPKFKGSRSAKLLSRLPVVAQAGLILSGAYDIYKAYKQG